MQELLEQIMKKCAAGFTLSVNPHRVSYESIEDYLIHEDFDFTNNSKIFEQMLSHNTLVEVQAYPATPIGFYSVYHYDIRRAIEETYKLLLEA